MEAPISTLEQLEVPLLEDRQPNHQTAVWQHNDVTVARYLLTESEQKLLLYTVAMIEPETKKFSRYRIEVAAYAKACGLTGKSVYEQLARAAKSISEQRPLVIMNHPDPDTGVPGVLSTHWFAEVQFGPGYITVVFPPSLSRYLVAVKSEFFQYELGIVLHFQGEYPARLYQWAKRWLFRGRAILPLAELRAVLGLIEWDAKGNVVKERYASYGDLKKWALLPALAEIERVSDILVRTKEIKKPGTKTVEAIEFTITGNPAYSAAGEPGAAPALPATKSVVVDPEKAKLTTDLQQEFGVTATQARNAIAKYGVERIRKKAGIVRAKPQKNAAAALLTALRDDWQPPKNTRPASPVKKAAPVASMIQPPLPLTEEEKAAHEEEFAAFKRKMRTASPTESADRPRRERPQFIPPTPEQIAAAEERRTMLLAQLAQCTANEASQEVGG